MRAQPPRSASPRKRRPSRQEFAAQPRNAPGTDLDAFSADQDANG
jgi:hypothetical protein